MGRGRSKKPDPFLGTTLKETYRVDELVGEGGMGAVYAATHLRLGSRVAIKFLLIYRLRDEGLEEGVHRFRREARVAMELNDENIVHIHDYDITPDETPYIVDFGPGVVRRAAAAELAGVTGLAVDRLTRAFCTHLHSDHTLGYPDLIFTPWVLGRDVPLQVYGPPGLRSMTDHVLAAWAEDIEVRSLGNQPSEELGYQVEVHEIEPGIVYTDERVKVTAFDVRHGAWTHAYGFRFDTPDRSVVISGDTVPVEAIAEQCDGCDVLVHEVYAKAGYDQREPDWQVYHAVSHTSGVQLGELAAQARPKLLVLTHQLLWGATEEQLLDEIRLNFDGEVVYANDLDVY